MTSSFSSSQRSLRLDLVKPLPIVIGLLFFWGVVLFVWLFTARIPITVSSEVIKVDEAGLVSAEFSPNAPIKAGQLARIDPVGQNKPSIDASVLNIDPNGNVLLLLTDEQEWLRLYKRELRIESVIIIVDKRSPITFWRPSNNE